MGRSEEEEREVARILAAGADIRMRFTAHRDVFVAVSVAKKALLLWRRICRLQNRKGASLRDPDHVSFRAPRLGSRRIRRRGPGPRGRFRNGGRDPESVPEHRQKDPSGARQPSLLCKAALFLYVGGCAARRAYSHVLFWIRAIPAG